MNNNKLATWLQNKFVLAALLMVLVAGTAAAGVVALRSGDSGEQEETEPGYAFQTEEDDQNNGQLLEQLEDGQEVADLTEGWLENDSEGIQDPKELQKAEDELLQKPENQPEDQPVQSGKVDTISGAQDSSEDHLTAMEDGLAEAETLVAGEDAVVYEPEDGAEEVIAPGATLDFQAGSTMGWPVFGNILLDYSMDSTIYFPTLEQYKCNPGILIQAEVGQTVEAAVRGQVTAIGFDEELGEFIMMDLGGDYTLLYGQLTELNVAVGQVVEPGYVLGTVAQPTKYYVVEGPNIYLEMRYQQEPVDPLDYIR